MSDGHLRIWVMLGHRTGDNNQLLALAEALKLPFETRTLRFNAFRTVSRWLGPTLVSLHGADRSTLRPPWPDLVLGIGWRSVSVARWIKRASDGRSRLVRIGNPRANARLFDLVITTPQYPVPDGPNVLRLPLGMSRYRSPPTPSPSETEFLAGLPRPHRLLAVGGPAKYWRLRADIVERAATALAAKGGTTIVATSPRTPDYVTSALAAHAPNEIKLVSGGHPRFAALLGDADEIHVTGDSVAMLSEAVLSGKPVGIVPIELDTHGQNVLGRHAETNRDLRRFWASLRDRGLAGTLDHPRAGQIADPATTAADAIKAVLGDRV